MFFLCEQLHTLILFVLIKLVQKNTMLYQLCFDIFRFIRLKTFSEQKTLQRCWLSDIRVILCSVSFWFMKTARTNECTYTQILIRTRITIAQRWDWIKLLVLQIVLRDVCWRECSSKGTSCGHSGLEGKVNKKVFICFSLATRKSTYWKCIYW